MDKLPVEVIRRIYEYDYTYKIDVDKVLTQLAAHVFIYRCSECFKEWNKCCFVIVKCVELIFAFAIIYIYIYIYIYFDKDRVYEYDLNDIVQLGF